MKCNPHPAIVKALAALGTNFDCASTGEMAQVLADGVAPEKIIFANPCKLVSNIKYANTAGVHKMTFDNEDELKKIAKHFPEAELVLRILPDDSHSMCKFGIKFGAPVDTWPRLFSTASSLGLKVIGVSFHVGSGCYDASAFASALQLARDCFDEAARHGYKLNFLDIGGGFPGVGEAKPSFYDIAEVVRPVLDELFPKEVRVIGEPGRYFATSTMTLITNVHSRRVTNEAGEKKIRYYVGEGVYGAFNCIFFDHQHPLPRLLEPVSDDQEKHLSNIFGPTCDSLDLIASETLLPELQVGEWMVFDNMGAYTCAAASSFNGFRTSRTFYVKSYS